MRNAFRRAGARIRAITGRVFGGRSRNAGSAAASSTGNS